MKKIISISIIAFSVFLGMIIIGRFSASENALDAEALGYKIVDQEKNPTENEGKFIESLEDVKTADVAEELDYRVKPDNDIEADGNITNQIANRIAQKIIGGAKDSDALMEMIKSGNPETIQDAYTLTEELVAKEAREINPDALKLIVQPSQLNLITDNSKTAKQKYLSDLDYILNSKMGKKPVYLDNKALNDIYLQLDFTVNDLKKLKTPSDLYQFHSETISILGGIKNGLSQIIAINSDPAKLLIVLESIEELNREFEELFQGVNKLI